MGEPKTMDRYFVACAGSEQRETKFHEGPTQPPGRLSVEMLGTTYDLVPRAEAKPTDDWCALCGAQTPATLFVGGMCPGCRGPATPATKPGTVRVVASDLAAQTREVELLRAQVTALQADNTRFVEERRACDWTEHVKQLFRLFEQDMPVWPGFPSEATIALRRKMLREEFNETMEALDERNFPEVVDGCIDTIVVAIGMLIAFGVDPRPFWTEVHRTNVAKLNGPVSADGKRLKPPGWEPPAIEAELTRRGWLKP